MSNGSNAVRKVTTTTTRIKTTKDGERLQETVTKTVMESLDGETPKTVAQTTSERNDMAGPVRKQIGVTEHTAPIKMDRGRRTSDVIITHPQKPTTDRPRVSGNGEIEASPNDMTKKGRGERDGPCLYSNQNGKLCLAYNTKQIQENSNSQYFFSEFFF